MERIWFCELFSICVRKREKERNREREGERDSEAERVKRVGV